MSDDGRHIPVMLDEVLTSMQPATGERIVDVDGLAFTIEPAGRVSSCAYSVSGRVLADVACSEG